MKIFIVFLIGVVVGVLAHRQFTQPKRETVAADSRETLRREVTNITQAFVDTFDPATIKEELAKTGRVVREKARKAGEAIADATADARTTAAIKTKLLKASSLSALKIDVDTTDGLVTLSGTVSAHEEIAQAVKLALETEGVHKVVSTLQVKSN
jgi:osmotically-inducible protein OsmY